LKVTSDTALEVHPPGVIARLRELPAIEALRPGKHVVDAIGIV